jgi:hypothetical protein
VNPKTDLESMEHLRQFLVAATKIHVKCVLLNQEKKVGSAKVKELLDSMTYEVNFKPKSGVDFEFDVANYV